jgi:hypothetical protein
MPAALAAETSDESLEGEPSPPPRSPSVDVSEQLTPAPSTDQLEIFVVALPNTSSIGSVALPPLEPTMVKFFLLAMAAHYGTSLDRLQVLGQKASYVGMLADASLAHKRFNTWRCVSFVWTAAFDPTILLNPEDPSLVESESTDSLRRRRSDELTDILAHVVNFKVFGGAATPVRCCAVLKSRWMPCLERPLCCFQDEPYPTAEEFANKVESNLSNFRP